MESVHPSTAIDRQASAGSSTTSRRNRWSRSSSSPRCGPSTSLGCCRCSRCVLLSVVGMANHRKTIGKWWFNGIYMGFWMWFRMGWQKFYPLLIHGLDGMSCENHGENGKRWYLRWYLPRNIDIGTLFEFWSGNWVRWLQKKGQQKKE